MPSFFSWLGGDPNVLINYFLGLIIIVLYAKDKFNTPTYDKESMGPFSQLPPQLLTIDARYRQGLRIYILLLLTLYTALCIIGPSTFGNQNIQLGFSASTAQLWPVASATFLISTGAAKDSSILGKIEHFVRQYAQKTAYIPSIVSKLAYAIRNADTTPWLAENIDKLKLDEFEDRKTVLTTLIGAKLVKKFNDNPRQQGHLSAWAHANIVFYSMHQMFRGVLPSEKLSQIIDVPENVAVFDRLKKRRDELEGQVVAAEEQRAGKPDSGTEVDIDKLIGEIQRFSKEVSLTITVLLSQSVRTFSDLRGRLEQLGFRKVELPDNSDHLVYIVMVNFCIMLGAFSAYTFASIPYVVQLIGSFGHLFQNVKLLDDFVITDRSNELLTLATGSLIYMIVFKVIDYLRDEYLDVSEWQENLQGYVMVVVSASVCSAIISILLMVLVLSPINLLQYMWEDPVGLVHQFLFQLLVAGLAASFAVTYMYDAVKVKWMIGGEDAEKREKKIDAETTRKEVEEEEGVERKKSVGEIIRQEFFRIRKWTDAKKIVHGLLAAVLVGVLTHATIVNKKNSRIERAKSNIDTLLISFDQSEGWLGQKVKAVRSSAAASEASSYVPLQWQDLIDITCKLRAMHAAVNAFDTREKELQLDPEFFKSPSDAASNSQPRQTDVPKCQRLDAKKATIDDQILALVQICEKLNRMGMSPAAKGGTSSSGAPSQPEAGQRIVVPTLFLAPERCELSKSTTSDPGEQNFRALGSSLGDLLYTLNGLNKFSNDTGLIAVAFPMISGFFIAYMFGAGCRTWRAWWLNNEVGQQEIQRLKEQIEKIYKKPVNERQYKEWLTTPLDAMNGVAPLEAVRYEGSKARLYGKIEGEQLDLAAVIVAG